MKLNKKTLILLVCATLLLTFTVSGTVAYLAAGTSEVKNVFEPGSVPPTVEEVFNKDDTVKKNVAIKNTGNVDAYIRVVLVGYWCDATGNIVAPWDPNDDDQGNFEGLTGQNWVENGGYYYYTLPVEPDTVTESYLFTAYTVGTAPVSGAHLVMNVLAQSVQADGWPEGTTAIDAFTAANTEPTTSSDTTTE